MVVRLPPHKHCPNCDDPIPEEENYCSEQCMVDHKIKEKKGSRKMTYFYIAAAAALIALWVLTLVKF